MIRPVPIVGGNHCAACAGVYAGRTCNPRRSLAVPPYGVDDREPAGSWAVSFRMEWANRVPAMDLPLRMLIPHGGEPPCHLQIDRLPDGRYRATAGLLPEVHELCRTPDRESLLRHADCLRACRSFREVLTALQQLSELDGGRDANNREPAALWRGRSADGSGQLKLRPAAA